MKADGGIDVLAVMQASADQLWRYRRDILASEQEAARAIVAELVDAVADVYGAPGQCVDDSNAADDPCPPECMTCRIRAALAKARGESA